MAAAYHGSRQPCSAPGRFAHRAVLRKLTHANASAMARASGGPQAGSARAVREGPVIGADTSRDGSSQLCITRPGEAGSRYRVFRYSSSARLAAAGSSVP